MSKKHTVASVLEKVYYYAGDVIASDRLKQEAKYRHHGSVSCYEHSVAVTLLSVRMADRLGLNVDMESMVKGALLHDYFLYDWRETGCGRRGHGFHHARCALANAQRDFELTSISCDVIEKHMFPLNIRLPKYKESVVVSIADKLCATKEVYRFVIGKLRSDKDGSVGYGRKRLEPNMD